jgi:DNA-binding IclR family transcriptional regulator
MRTFSILEFLARQGEARLSDISTATRLDASTVHRLLSTLKEMGYVRQVTGRKYRFSSRLAWLVRPDFHMRERARPLLDALASETGETVSLGILDGTDVLYLETVERKSNFSMRLPVGQKMPAYCSALGKAILSCLSFDEVQELFRDVPFRRYTRFSLKDPDELWGDLEATRSRGYALDRMESHDGLSCVGAPLRIGTGKVWGGVSVSCPSSSCCRDGTVPDSVILKLLVAAGKISSILEQELPYHR